MRLANRLKLQPKTLLWLMWAGSITMLGLVYLAPAEYVPGDDWWVLVSFLVWLYAVAFPLVKMWRAFSEHRRERDKRKARERRFNWRKRKPKGAGP